MRNTCYCKFYYSYQHKIVLRAKRLNGVNEEKQKNKVKKLQKKISTINKFYKYPSYSCTCWKVFKIELVSKFVGTETSQRDPDH